MPFLLRRSASRQLAAAGAQHGVPARDAVVVDAHGAVGVAADDVLAPLAQRVHAGGTIGEEQGETRRQRYTASRPELRGGLRQV